MIPRCACGHSYASHTAWGIGPCDVGQCGCDAYRPEAWAQAASDDLPDPTTPASAEPTEDDMAVGYEIASHVMDWGDDLFQALQYDIAKGLASQRAEIVARYEKLADQLDGQARILRKMALTAEDDEGAELDHAAAAIREAAPK